MSATAIGNDVLVSRYVSGGAGTTVWPVSRDAVKANAQIPHTDDDTLLLNPTDDTGIIPRAVAYVEEMGRVALITQTRRVVHDDGFPTEIETRWPLQSVTSVTYLDADYATQTVSASGYRVLTAGKPGRIRAKTATPWATTIIEKEVVIATYLAGFGNAATSVPAEWKTPVLLLASYWWRNRESYDSQFVSQSFFDVLKQLINAAGGLLRYV